MDRGQNMAAISENNRKAVLQYLMLHSVTTRVEIAKSIGLKQATITNIINSFLEMQIVKETHSMKGEKGKRSIGISMNFSKYKIIAVLITKLRVQIIVEDLGFQVYEQEVMQLKEGQTARQTLDALSERVNRILANDINREICAIGVAVPGPFLRKEVRIPIMSWMPGWQDIYIKKELEERFHLPVYVEHDANAAALGEWRFGTVKEKNNALLYVNAGKGIGSGLIIDGKIYRGNLGIAGELGHVAIQFDGEKCECGNRGCLERYCSVISFERLIRRKLEKGEDSILSESSTLEEMLQAAANGDQVAVSAIEDVADKLAYGLVSAINLFDPKEIIISGELARVGEPLLWHVVASIKERVLPVVFDNLVIRLSNLNREAYRLGICELTATALINSGRLLKPAEDLSAESDDEGERIVFE